MLSNEQRIKMLTAIGFEHQTTLNEDGSAREHIITHPSYKGLFINHTSLLCAMQRIPTVCFLLGRAHERFVNE